VGRKVIRANGQGNGRHTSEGLKGTVALPQSAHVYVNVCDDKGASGGRVSPWRTGCRDMQLILSGTVPTSGNYIAACRYKFEAQATFDGENSNWLRYARQCGQWCRWWAGTWAK